MAEPNFSGLKGQRIVCVVGTYRAELQIDVFSLGLDLSCALQRLHCNIECSAILCYSGETHEGIGAGSCRPDRFPGTLPFVQLSGLLEEFGALLLDADGLAFPRSRLGQLFKRLPILSQARVEIRSLLILRGRLIRDLIKR